MSAEDRRAYARRLRLEWASQGDIAHAAAVERMIEEGARLMASRPRLP